MENNLDKWSQAQPIITRTSRLTSSQSRDSFDLYLYQTDAVFHAREIVDLVGQAFLLLRLGVVKVFSLES